jgi:hypothetical protein
MNSHLIRLTIVQCAHQTRSWISPVGLVVAIVLAAKNGVSQWNDFYAYGSLTGLLALFPLLVCAGIVASEVESGRALLLHSFGISRGSFIFCRILGAAAFCLLVASAIQLVLGIYLSLTHHNIDWPGAVSLFLGSGIYFLYSACLLAFLSTMVRSWGNTLAVFLLLFLVYPYLEHVCSAMPSLLRVVRLIMLGPLYMIFMPPGAKAYLMGDLFITVSGMAALMALAIIIYRRSEIGRRANA